MSNFSINEMQSMQKELQDKYKEKWERICPETGKNKFLWMIGEIGEVIDIIKKNGDKSAVADSSVREHLIEEMADVLMCYAMGSPKTNSNKLISKSFKKT